jgi:cytochrome P450
MLFDNIFQNASYAKVGIISGVGFLLYFASRAYEECRIRALGHHAAKRYSYVPLGLDMLYEVIDNALKHQMIEYWWRLFGDYGNKVNPYTVEAGVGKGRVILTADPENIKAILATQFQDYGKGEQFNKDWHEFLGDSIFATDGKKWHDSRQLIRPQFIKDRLSDIKVFEKHVGILLPMLGGNGETIDIANLFFRYTLDAATDFLLGRSVDSLIHEQARFAEAFSQVQHIQSLIQRFGIFQWMVPRGRFHKEIKVLNEFVNSFVDDALRLSPAELEKTAKSDDGYTFLHAIASYTRDRSMLRDQLVAVLLAGRDTTACTLSWTFYELSNHPKIVQRLRSEILQQVGPVKTPTYADLKSMRYLQVSEPRCWDFWTLVANKPTERYE